MDKDHDLNIKSKIEEGIKQNGISYLLGYLMSKSTKLDKEKCLKYVNKIIENKINEVGKDFVAISNSKHNLSELSNEDLLKDNDKIIKG